tara:strand:- start:676 stop:783 length:108 start_codon:yes stop_codon:yes gene_type:complete
MTNTIEASPFLIEYFSGIEKGDFYEEPVEEEYPDW